VSLRILPGVVAVLVGAMLVTAVFVPYVAHGYRRRGQLGPGYALLAAAALVEAALEWESGFGTSVLRAGRGQQPRV